MNDKHNNGLLNTQLNIFNLLVFGIASWKTGNMFDVSDINGLKTNTILVCVSTTSIVKNYLSHTVGIAISK